MLVLPVTKLPAHHLSVWVCPAVVTNCPPLTMVKDFYTSFMAHSTPNQSHSTVCKKQKELHYKIKGLSLK